MPVMRMFAASIAAILFVAGVALSACGGDEDGQSFPDRDTTPTVSSGDETPEPTATENREGGSPEPTATDDEEESPTAPAVDADPEFLASLSGYIVFTSERADEQDGTRDDLYIMNADGSDVRRLTSTDRNEWWPDVAPDGSALLYGRNYEDRLGSTTGSNLASFGIFIEEEGGEPVDLTDNVLWHSGPEFSPDGSSILFDSDRTGELNVFVMNRNGSRRQQLTSEGGQSAAWSPDGSEIVLVTRSEGREDSDISIMNADGSSIRAVRDGPEDDSRPRWSPDGTQILFDSDRDGDDREIYVMDLDGGNIRQLTDNEADDDFAQWSPDGQFITFVSDRDGNNEIYVMAADGSNQTNVSNNPAFEAFPTWSETGFGE